MSDIKVSGMNSILDKYTDKELIEVLEQECEALGINCESNGLETKFENIVLPHF